MSTIKEAFLKSVSCDEHGIVELTFMTTRERMEDFNFSGLRYILDIKPFPDAETRPIHKAETR